MFEFQIDCKIFFVFKCIDLYTAYNLDSGGYDVLTSAKPRQAERRSGTLAERGAAGPRQPSLYIWMWS